MTAAAYAAAMLRDEQPDEPIVSAAANRAWSAYYATGSWQAAFEQLAAEEDAL